MLLRMSNVSALNTWRNLSALDLAMGKSLEKLSSGRRINRASDDPSGLAIAERMQARFRSMKMAVRNVQDGVSLLQTAEGSLSEVHSMLHRMRELALQASTGTLTPEDRAPIQEELDQIVREITRLTESTEFNGRQLLDGGLQGLQLQIGPDVSDALTVAIRAMDAFSLGLTRDALSGAVEGPSPNPYVISVGKAGASLAAGTYQVVYNHGDRKVHLEDMSGNAIGIAVDAAPNTTVVIGNKETAQTLEITLGDLLPFDDRTVVRVGAPLAVANGNTPTATLQSNTVAASLTAAGGGLTDGSYRLHYDSITQSVQLFDSLNNAIGAAAPLPVFGGPVTVGDANTGQTVTIAPVFPYGALDADDLIAVTDNPVAADQILAGADPIKSVGYNLSKGTYRVAFDAVTTMWQLQSETGGAIGGWQAANPDGTVTLGEVGTGRQLTVAVNTLQTVSGWGTVTVLNDQGVSAPATYRNGARLEGARAGAGLNVSTQTAANEAIKQIDRAIGAVSTQRAQLGAVTNGLEHQVNFLNISAENLAAAESRIRDLDMAEEMSTFTKLQIQMQAATAMLAQANQLNRLMVELVTGR
ncbi:MAG TPA: flagellin [Symbiobacteriaceae bacterium]|nr:flagellin [Symbiobacteriaceae bacterium]